MAYLQLVKDFKDRFNEPTYAPVKSAIRAMGSVITAEESWRAEKWDIYFSFYYDKLREVWRTLNKILFDLTLSGSESEEAKEFLREIVDYKFLKRIYNWQAYSVAWELISIAFITVNINARIHQLDWRVREVLKEASEIVDEIGEEIWNFFSAFKDDPEVYAIVSDKRNKHF